MKKNEKTTQKTIMLYVALTLTGVMAGHAQVNLLDPIHIPDTNSLLSTTGPNTLGKGHLQLSCEATWYDWQQNLETYNGVIHHHSYREVGGGLGVRYGLGNRFELFGHLEGVYSQHYFELMDTILKGSIPLFVPSLGIKMMLHEGGHGWIPQVSLFAQVGMPSNNRGLTGQFPIDPVLGFQFRNRLNNRWMLDYGISYCFNDLSFGSFNAYPLQRDNPLQFNLMARWLATDRLMVSAGMENVGGVAEVLWQTTPTLQLKAQVGLSAGMGFRSGITETSALLGINWMLK